MIPPQLKDQKFILTGSSKGEKVPIESDWQNTNNYFLNDIKFQNHLQKGGTYGVLTGYNNLVVIDFDNADVQAEVIVFCSLCLAKQACPLIVVIAYPFKPVAIVKPAGVLYPAP